MQVVPLPKCSAWRVHFTWLCHIWPVSRWFVSLWWLFSPLKWFMAKLTPKTIAGRCTHMSLEHRSFNTYWMLTRLYSRYWVKLWASQFLQVSPLVEGKVVNSMARGSAAVKSNGAECSFSCELALLGVRLLSLTCRSYGGLWGNLYLLIRKQ